MRRSITRCLRWSKSYRRLSERCDAAGVRTFTPRERERRCGIVTLECEHPEEVEARLHKEGVIVDSRPGRVRLSPHWCVTDVELERGMDLVLASLSPSGERVRERGEEAQPVSRFGTP